MCAPEKSDASQRFCAHQRVCYDRHRARNFPGLVWYSVEAKDHIKLFLTKKNHSTMLLFTNVHAMNFY